ncbi:hypothetical protein ACFU9X_11530 [Streptomyces atratus]|uniref:hypothetical protein n=1 Tax=Streptomyces atratus TaxID=1893 RepID=UPI0036839053
MVGRRIKSREQVLHPAPASDRPARTPFSKFRSGAKQRHQVGAGDRAPAVLGGPGRLEHHRQGRSRAAGAAGVTSARSLTAQNVDSIALVVRRRTQHSAGKPWNATDSPAPSVCFATALGHFVPQVRANALMATPRTAPTRRRHL